VLETSEFNTESSDDNSTSVYAAEIMTDIYAVVYALAQTLLVIVPYVTAAAQRLVARA
jgi:hypothetical protein